MLKVPKELANDILEYMHWSIQTFQFLKSQTGLNETNSPEIIKATESMLKLAVVAGYVDEHGNTITPKKGIT